MRAFSAKCGRFLATTFRQRSAQLVKLNGNVGVD